MPSLTISSAVLTHLLLGIRYFCLVVHAASYILSFLTRDNYTKRVLAIVEATVCQSVRPSPLALCQNGASHYHKIFTVGCHKDSVFTTKFLAAG